jgi:hypothetical protein
MKVIKAVAFANGMPCPHAGQWLSRADFEAHNGQGHMTFTDNPRRAMKFADAAAALSYWQTPSRKWPLRPDGKPNRPLTALTVEIEDAPTQE